MKEITMNLETRRPLLALLSASALVLAPNAIAQHDAHQHHAPAPTATQTALATGQGIVKKIDPETQRLTLAHDAIEKLGWPAMTMSFAVTDKALLKEIKIGDVVRFELQNEQTITAVEVLSGK